MRRRKHRRYIKRLETDFFFGAAVHKGISSNLSDRGIFIRSRTCLTVGSHIDFVIYFPDGTNSRLSGTVRRAIRTDSELVRNGMGIEILAYDESFARFMREQTGADLKGAAKPGDDVHGKRRPVEKPRGIAERRIIACPSCGVKNRIAVEKLSEGPRCGRCGEKLN